MIGERLYTLIASRLSVPAARCGKSHKPKNTELHFAHVPASRTDDRTLTGPQSAAERGGRSGCARHRPCTGADRWHRTRPRAPAAQREPCLQDHRAEPEQPAHRDGPAQLRPRHRDGPARLRPRHRESRARNSRRHAQRRPHPTPHARCRHTVPTLNLAMCLHQRARAVDGTPRRPGAHPFPLQCTR